jgi:alpha-mannosidase
MATYRQTVSVERSQPQLEVLIEFDTLETPASGNPWMTYYACRFAWDNESAAITRSILGQACGFRSERFETPDYIEIADQDHRLLIVPHGRPYHRRTSGRTLDSLLLVEGEDCRSFRFTLDFDQPFPMRTVLETNQPALVLETSASLPAKDNAGWVLRSTAKNMLVTSLEGCEEAVQVPQEGQKESRQLRFLLQETEGRSVVGTIQTARTAKSARLRHPNGSTVQELTVTADGVRLQLSRFEIRELEITF